MSTSSEQPKDNTTPEKPQIYKKLVQRVSKGKVKNLPTFTEILQENNKFLFKKNSPKKTNSPKKKFNQRPHLKKKRKFKFIITKSKKIFSINKRIRL